MDKQFSTVNGKMQELVNSQAELERLIDSRLQCQTPATVPNSGYNVKLRLQCQTQAAMPNSGYSVKLRLQCQTETCRKINDVHHVQ